MSASGQQRVIRRQRMSPENVLWFSGNGVRPNKPASTSRATIQARRALAGPAPI
jgi:hypothetical protein